MYGDPALPPDFVSLPYANPDAPKGGRIVMGDTGTFDSLNPFIVKGQAPYWVAPLTIETLMGRSSDEPFTLYPLLAESVEVPPDRAWVEFTLNPKARFSDGRPVTVADVIWSMQTLGTKGSPVYSTAWKKVAKVEQTGPRSVRFTFSEPDRELPLILALRPILEKAQWQGKDFSASSLMVPVGSGPYVVGKVDPGHSISFRRNPDWWGKDLPFNRGQWNFDEIDDDFFADSNVMFEAFKAGVIDVYREANDARWKTNFDFPAVRSGQVVLSDIPNRRPSGMTGLAMNTRRALFSDWRVRQAMIDAFNFPFINRTLNGGAAARITSYFSNSELGMQPGPATGKVLADLAPFRDSLPPGAISGYTLPAGTGGTSDRASLRQAAQLLEEAGWTVQQGVLKNARGEPFRFDILLPQGAARMQSAVDIYIASLRRLGMQPHITVVDSAQYFQRILSYDFDMTQYQVALSLSPGNEQYLYFGEAGFKEPGTRNLMGVHSAAVQALIGRMLTVHGHEDFVAAVRALDRVLMAGRYVVPVWYTPLSHIAHARELHFPKDLPIYGDWAGFLPNVWWYGK